MARGSRPLGNGTKRPFVVQHELFLISKMWVFFLLKKEIEKYAFPSAHSGCGPAGPERRGGPCPGAHACSGRSSRGRAPTCLRSGGQQAGQGVGVMQRAQSRRRNAVQHRFRGEYAPWGPDPLKLSVRGSYWQNSSILSFGSYRLLSQKKRQTNKQKDRDHQSSFSLPGSGQSEVGEQLNALLGDRIPVPPRGPLPGEREGFLLPGAEDREWLGLWPIAPLGLQKEATLEMGKGDGPLSPHSGLGAGLPDKMQDVRVILHFA